MVALYAELDEKSERLRVASESKDRFWANVSHELRTPLNSIIGLARLLAEPDPGRAAAAEQLYQVQLIRNSGSALLALVNDLLDVAKAESGRLRIEPAGRAVARAAWPGCGPWSGRWPSTRQIAVTVSDETHPETVLTDELALTSILRNLLSNASSTPNDGEVRLTVEAGGVEPGHHGRRHRHRDPRRAQQTRVFEEFYQVPGAPPRRDRARPALCPPPD